MRIIAGAHRGTKLVDVGTGDAAAHLRPTTDRVRESLFNVLAGGKYGQPIVGARVLDLFAGTGALGLEALSRGAAHVTFVDNGRVAQKLITENIAKLRRDGDCHLIKSDVAQMAPTDRPCELVFLDPPYGKSLGAGALTAAHAAGWIAPDALIVWEDNVAQMAPAGFTRRDIKKYGNSQIMFLKADA